MFKGCAFAELDAVVPVCDEVAGDKDDEEEDGDADDVLDELDEAVCE